MSCVIFATFCPFFKKGEDSVKASETQHTNFKMPEENVKTYTYEEIAEHSTSESAWIVIENGVYDVTKFLEEHPGGPDILLDWAGQEDATDAFEDAGHSLDAREQMKAYKIGEIAEEEKTVKPKAYDNIIRRLGVLIPVSVVLAGLLVYTVIRLRK
ncbi:cytochrome b5-like isoform X2 [Argiope bruennichi]|uniref:cytochrome b5-like isoform X2 n=1 Tax=Argiope bruennichi TaxID=94029 RepID=UPI00249524F6|nr:cytochrome b5-like isoform X2 [Argiope bruennichi]